MIKTVIALCSSLFLFAAANGQSLVFNKKLGRSSDASFGRSVKPLYDGNFIIAGYSCDTAIGSSNDAMLMKITPAGDTLWIKTIGTPGNNDVATGIVQTPDSGLAIVGFTASTGAGQDDMWLIRTDKSGNVLWQKTYGGYLDERGYAIQLLSNGFILAGSAQTFSATLLEDVYVVRTDLNGDTLWTGSFGDDLEDVASDIVQTDDKGFLLTGYITSTNIISTDLLLAKFDSLGKLEWRKEYSDSYGFFLSEKGSKVLQAPDGGYVVTGTKRQDDFTPMSGELWVIKTDNQGDTLRTWSYGNNTDISAFGKAMAQTPHSGYIVTSDIYVHSLQDFATFIFRFDKKGNGLWGSGVDHAKNFATASDVCMVGDDRYMVAGSIDSANANRAMCILFRDDKQPTGINTISKKQLSVWPNPVPAVLHIDGEVRLPFNFTIYDISGRTMQCGRSNTAMLVVETLGPGVYFMKIGTDSWAKFIKQ